MPPESTCHRLTERRSAMRQKPAANQHPGRAAPGDPDQPQGKNAAVSWVSTAATCSRTEMATKSVSSMSSTIRDNEPDYEIIIVAY